MKDVKVPSKPKTLFLRNIEVALVNGDKLCPNCIKSFRKRIVPELLTAINAYSSDMIDSDSCAQEFLYAQHEDIHSALS